MDDAKPIPDWPGFAAVKKPIDDRLRQIDFNIVREFHIRRVDLSPNYDIDLVLEHSHHKPPLFATIRFQGVSKLTIRGDFPKQIFLGFADVSHWGWENTFFQAFDIEGYGFKLLCRDVDLISLSIQSPCNLL